MSARVLLLAEAKSELLMPWQWQALNALLYSTVVKATKMQLQERYDAQQRIKR